MAARESRPAFGLAMVDSMAGGQCLGRCQAGVDRKDPLRHGPRKRAIQYAVTPRQDKPESARCTGSPASAGDDDTVCGTDGAYSIDSLADFTTLPHFTVSSAKSLPNAAGDIGIGTPPSWAMRTCIPGSASAALTALLRTSITSGGVPLGAAMPYHTLAS